MTCTIVTSSSPRCSRAKHRLVRTRRRRRRHSRQQAHEALRVQFTTTPPKSSLEARSTRTTTYMPAATKRCTSFPRQIAASTSSTSVMSTVSSWSHWHKKMSKYINDAQGAEAHHVDIFVFRYKRGKSETPIIKSFRYSADVSFPREKISKAASAGLSQQGLSVAL